MSKKKLYILIMILVFAFTFVLFGNIAKATNGDSDEPADTSETDGDGEGDTGGLGAPIGGEEPTGLADYINRIYDFAVVAGISLAILVIIFAGYKYMASSGDPQSTAEAKELLVGAIIGLVLILLTRLILVSIDPRILQFPQRNPLHDIQRAGPGGGTTEPNEITAEQLCEAEKLKKSLAWNIGCLTKDLNGSGYAVAVSNDSKKGVDNYMPNNCNVSEKFYEFDQDCKLIRKVDVPSF